MQTLPHRPQPTEPFDSYAYRLLSKGKLHKRKDKANVDWDMIMLLYITLLADFLIYGKYWFHLF